MIPIESISQLNEITTVYNLRVADHHTYFVGGALWGWDVWVHNAYRISSGLTPQVPSWGTITSNFNGVVRPRTQGVLSFFDKWKAKFVSGLTSGFENADSTVPGIRAMFDTTEVENWHHVEMQAIFIMRDKRIRNATLQINNPKGLCKNCGDLRKMEHYLPSGYNLKIVGADGTELATILGKGVLRSQ